MQASKSKAFGILIGGSWIDSSSGKTFASVNPADNSDLLGHFQQATLEETRQAIEAARTAQPGWAAAAPQKRADVLNRAAQLIEEGAGELARLLTREEGK